MSFQVRQLPPQPDFVPMEGVEMESISSPQDATRLPDQTPRVEDPRLQEEASVSAVDGSGLSRNSSIWQDDHMSGFMLTDGDVGGSGCNETSVDIVAVPCIGASPDHTWTRDPIPAEGLQSLAEFGETAKHVAEGSLLSPAISRPLSRAPLHWIRGIKQQVSNARVMLYRHRELSEGLTLDKLADDLLEHVRESRQGLTSSRPIFFVCHSIGGLVAKLALVKASKQKDPDLRQILLHCHGMTFFATPHRGSSYMSMWHLRESIQSLLFLSQPLPLSIMDELRLNHKSLLDTHDAFIDIASEVRIWTFYETIDSQLSGSGSSDFDEVHFTAPLASIKSSLVGNRTEKAFSLESDHAHCASFGINNLETMDSYLQDLGEAIEESDKLVSKWTHVPLELKDKVKVELVGFYDDPDPDTSSDVRLYVSKHYLREFLEKGPELCLKERLNTVAANSRRAAFPPLQRLRHAPGGVGNLAFSALGILGDFLGRTSERPESQTRGTDRGILPQSPDIVVTQHTPPRPTAAPATMEPTSIPPPGRPQELAVPSQSTPSFNRRSRRSSSQSSAGTNEEIPTTVSDTKDPDISPRTIGHALGPSTKFDASAGTERQCLENDSKVGKDGPSRAMTSHGSTAGFSRPDPKRRKFMWIHLPYNNPHWVKRIFGKLSETQHQNYDNLLKHENWNARHVQGRHAQAHASYVRPGCGFVPSETHASPRSHLSGSSGGSSPGPSPSHLYLYLPYLHFDTYLNVVRRRNIINKRRKHGRVRPVPGYVADLASLEQKVIWEFIGHDPPLNPRRTLDQYGYPSLLETYARDDDQMLYKLTKERVTPPRASKDAAVVPRLGERHGRSKSQRGSIARLLRPESPTRATQGPESDDESDILDGNVLMVDQLWLWSVDMTTLTTFFPKRESRLTEGPMFQQADLRNSIYNELNGDLTSRCENALDLAAFVALHAVTVLLDRTSHADLEIFRIFEEALGLLTERMTSSLKHFRMQKFRDAMLDLSDSESEFGGNKTASIKKRYRRETKRAERTNREHTSALLELRDMEDELKTMKNLFEEQRATIQTMREQYDRPELEAHTHNGRQFLDEALGRLGEYRQQTTDMMARIETTHKDYDKFLEMVQRQAQVDEVRWSRLQTQLASTQGLSVMIFTTFTVIFLPLSFFTSLFGMNTAEWANQYPSIRLIGAIALPASAFVVAVSLVAAFSTRVQGLIKATFRCAQALFRSVWAWLAALRGTEAEKAGEGRRKRRFKDEARRTRRNTEKGYDFWEQVHWGRGSAPKESAYEVPDLNRRPKSPPRPPRTGTWLRRHAGRAAV